MEAIAITGGTEKQNAWASEIATKWVDELSQEISKIEAHAYVETLGTYPQELRDARATLIAGLGKITAKQVIDLHVAQRSPVNSIIAKAQAAAKKG